MKDFGWKHIVGFAIIASWVFFAMKYFAPDRDLAKRFERCKDTNTKLQLKLQKLKIDARETRSNKGKILSILGRGQEEELADKVLKCQKELKKCKEGGDKKKGWW